MCCFSLPVPFVSKTNIFAREASRGGQYLAYSMTFTTRQRVAMVLPLPVAPGSGDDAVSFIDLSGYPEMFEHLQKGFPYRDDRDTETFRGGGGRGVVAPLPVVNVERFEASFVPTVDDFDRLDERFRIRKDVWARLGSYESFGFAVVKLREGSEQTLHPFALRFPRADTSSLYFPTVHWHGEGARDTAHFDHSLFCQRVAHPLKGIPASVAPPGPWGRSSSAARTFARATRTHGIIDPDIPCLRLVLQGTHPNRDIYVPA